MSKTLKILQLYPREMNIYGDNGNMQILKKRAELYGFDVDITTYNIGDNMQNLREADIILGGGGQDSGQTKIASDLQKIAPEIRALAASGIPMLLICGMYQLFGESFRTRDGDEIFGVELFDVKTVAGDNRLVGDIIIQTDFGEIFGYENHSGATILQENQAAFGEILKGFGNNGNDKSEGARSFNSFGSYLHGPILSKNPNFADEIIRLAIERKFDQKTLQARDEDSAVELKKIDDLAKKAREILRKHSH